MGMFDAYKPFEEHFNPGDRFTLEDAKLGVVLNTKHGPSQQVLFKVGGEWYSALGTGFVQQVGRMDASDRNTAVAYAVVPTKTGDNRVKLLLPAAQVNEDGTPTEDDIPF